MTKTQIKKYIEEVLSFLDKKSSRMIVLSFNIKSCRTGVFKDNNGVFYLEIGNDTFKECKKNKDRWKNVVEYVICHEYGHIYHDTSYDTYQMKIESEYKAERYGLNKLKKYFPEAHKWAVMEGIRALGDKRWAKCKRERHYRVAWGMIKEYKNVSRATKGKTCPTIK